MELYGLFISNLNFHVAEGSDELTPRISSPGRKRMTFLICSFQGWKSSYKSTVGSTCLLLPSQTHIPSRQVFCSITTTTTTSSPLRSATNYAAPHQQQPLHAHGNTVISWNFSDGSYSQLSSPLRKERGRKAKYGTSLSKGTAACVGADGRVKQIKAPHTVFFSFFLGR